jgi:hypothetical protein
MSAYFASAVHSGGFFSTSRFLAPFCIAYFWLLLVFFSTEPLFRVYTLDLFHAVDRQKGLEKKRFVCHNLRTLDSPRLF